MEFLEKHLEDIIWESDNTKLQERGLFIEGKKLRQLRIGNYGIADIVTFNKAYLDIQCTKPYLEITVYELKKDKIGIGAFLQAVNYVQGIKSYFNEYRPKIHVAFNIVLCGKEIDKSGSFVYLTDLIFGYENLGTLNFLSYYTYSYSLDGLIFKKEENYNLVNKGF